MEKMRISATLFLVLSVSQDMHCDNVQEKVGDLFQSYTKWKLGTDRFFDVLIKALQNWKIFVSAYVLKRLCNFNDYNETIMMITITQFTS